jgi:hypothetical protein
VAGEHPRRVDGVLNYLLVLVWLRPVSLSLANAAKAAPRGLMGATKLRRIRSISSKSEGMVDLQRFLSVTYLPWLAVSAWSKAIVHMIQHYVKVSCHLEYAGEDFLGLVLFLLKPLWGTPAEGGWQVVESGLTHRILPCSSTGRRSSRSG